MYLILGFLVQVKVNQTKPPSKPGNACKYMHWSPFGCPTAIYLQFLNNFLERPIGPKANVIWQCVTYVCMLKLVVGVCVCVCKKNSIPEIYVATWFLKTTWGALIADPIIFFTCLYNIFHFFRFKISNSYSFVKSKHYDWLLCLTHSILEFKKEMFCPFLVFVHVSHHMFFISITPMILYQAAFQQ